MSRESKSYSLVWSSPTILIMAHWTSARMITSRTIKLPRRRHIASEIENNPRAGLPLRSPRSMDPHSPTSFGDADRSSSRISATRRADPSARDDLEESDRQVARGGKSEWRCGPTDAEEREECLGSLLWFIERDFDARADLDKVKISQAWKHSELDKRNRRLSLLENPSSLTLSLIPLVLIGNLFSLNSRNRPCPRKYRLLK